MGIWELGRVEYRFPRVRQDWLVSSYWGGEIGFSFPFFFLKFRVNIRIRLAMIREHILLSMLVKETRTDLSCLGAKYIRAICSRNGPSPEQ